MKRFAVSLVLVVIVVAAAVAAGQLGLFKHPGSTQAEMKWPAQRGPALVIPAPRSMTTLQIASLLTDWTFPGAKDQTGQFTLPHTKMDAQAKSLTMFACRFAINGSASKVRRFYADKLKVDPNAGAAFSGVPVRGNIAGYANAIQDAITPRPPIGMGNGGFTLSTGDYVIRAVVAHKAGQKQTVVTLLLFPYSAVIPPSCKPPHLKQANEALADPMDKNGTNDHPLL